LSIDPRQSPQPEGRAAHLLRPRPTHILPAVVDRAHHELAGLEVTDAPVLAGHGPIDKVGSIALCNPRYASRILADANNRKVTAFMPLAIGVYEDGKGQVYVPQLDVGLMGMMFGGTIAEVMGVAGKNLNAVVAAAVGK
jgi:hypothetical protein